MVLIWGFSLENIFYFSRIFTHSNINRLMNQTTNIRKPDIKISIGARTRVTLLFTVFLLSHLASFGQIKTPKIEKPHIETPNKDSLNTEIKNKVDEKKQQVTDQFNLKKEKIKEQKEGIKQNTLDQKDSLKSRASTQINAKKDEFGVYRDSLLKLSFKDIIGDIPSFKGSKDSLKGGLKSSIVQIKDRVKSSTSFSGEIVSESFVTNYQDPFTVSEMMYSRFYGNPTVQVGTLPFTVDFFVTTEDNTFYNSNSFNIRFNTEQFKNNLRQKAYAKLQGATKKKEILAQKKSELGKQKSRLKNRLSQEKTKLDNLENQLGNLEEKAKNKIPNAPDKPNVNVKDKINVEGKVDALKQKQRNRLNGITQRIENKKDSMTNLDNHLNSDRVSGFDSAKYAEYVKRRAQYDDLLRKYELMDSIYTVVQSLDSNYGDKVKNLNKEYANPNFLKDKAAEKFKSKKLANLLNSVDYFELGINYPFFSRLSLNGTPVKGLNTGFTSGKNHFKIVGGKTFNNQINTFGLNQPNPEFNRNVQGILFERKSARGSFEVSNTSIWDNATETEPKRNFVQTVSLDQQIGKKLTVKINTAHSVYTDNTKLPKAEINRPSFLEQRLNQLALGTEMRYRLDAQSKLKVVGQRIYPGFMNVSNPYMRNGYDEYKAQLDRKFFKRRLHTTFFYKHFSDNITHIQENTNTMKGYGISARTSFKKGPNFFAQHAPYEQGNNHPDSIFRTNNQLSVSSVGMIYIKQLKKTNLSIITNYTRSQIDFNKGDAPVENVFYNAMISAKGSKMSLSLNGYRNQSKPKIDTLNYSGARIEIEQQGSGKLRFATSLFIDYYDSKDYRYNWVTTASFSGIKKLNIETSFGIGLIDGLYGVDRKDIYSGRVLMAYRL